MLFAFALVTLAVPALAAEKAFLGCFKNIPPGGPVATVTSEAACDALCKDYPYEFYTTIKGGAARCQCADKQPNGLGNWQDAQSGDQCQAGDARGYRRNPPYTHTGECFASPWFYSAAYSPSTGMFGGSGAYSVKTNPKQADTTIKCFDTCEAAGFEYALYNAKPGNQMYCVCANGYRGNAGACTGDTYYVYGRGGSFSPATSSTSASASRSSTVTSSSSSTVSFVPTTTPHSTTANQTAQPLTTTSHYTPPGTTVQPVATESVSGTRVTHVPVTYPSMPATETEASTPAPSPTQESSTVEKVPAPVEPEVAVPSALRKREHTTSRQTPSAYRCMKGLTACAIPGTSNWECVDPMNDLEACGGCTTGGFGDGIAGVDCTALPGVKATGVACQAGRCVVTACRAGYSLFAGQCVSY